MTKLLTRAQYDKWLAKVPKNICTFCKWTEYQIVLKEFDFWIWIACNAPYWRGHTMLIPKRHFVEYYEMNKEEASELRLALYHAKTKILDSKMKREDGSPVKKVVHFWRFRVDRFDPISGTTRPDHFHIHVTPDKDHLWDPILDKHPEKFDIVKVLGSSF